MKLYELTGIKNETNDMMIDDLFQYYLEKSGYKKLGAGLTGVALKHPTKNEIIKFWFNDVGYEDFLNYATTHKNKHLVKVLSKPKTLRLRTKNINNVKTLKKIKYVRLEYLKPFTENINLFGIPFNKFRTLLRAISGEANKDVLIHNALNVVFNDSMYKVLGIDIKKIDIDGFRDFVRLYMDIVQSVPDVIAWADLHKGNIMMRGDVPVIIDPLANSGSIDSTAYMLTYNVKNIDDFMSKMKS